MPSVRRNQPVSAGTLPPLPQPPTPLHEFSVCGTASIGRACMIHGRSLDFGRIYFEIPPTPKSAKIHVWPAHASVAACDPHVAPWGSSVCRPVHGHGRSCSSRPLDRSASMDSAGFRRGNARHFGTTSRLVQPRATPQHAARLPLTCLPASCAPDRPSDDNPFLAPRDMAVSEAPRAARVLPHVRPLAARVRGLVPVVSPCTSVDAPAQVGRWVAAATASRFEGSMVGRSARPDPTRFRQNAPLAARPAPFSASLAVSSTSTYPLTPSQARPRAFETIWRHDSGESSTETTPTDPIQPPTTPHVRRPDTYPDVSRRAGHP